MGAVARSVKEAGGRVVGVIPEFMKVRELAFDAADELVTVITMRERKLLMETRADAFVTLPGGFGTLEEIMEILTLRQLNVVKKPCVFFNQDGFYDDLLRLFERMLQDKFFKPSNMQLFRVATTVPEIFAQIEASAGVHEANERVVRIADASTAMAQDLTSVNAATGEIRAGGEQVHAIGETASIFELTADAPERAAIKLELAARVGVAAFRVQGDRGA
jgi:uncharacterized protein (TIGR00730 family)